MKGVIKPYHIQTQNTHLNKRKMTSIVSHRHNILAGRGEPHNQVWEGPPVPFVFSDALSSFVKEKGLPLATSKLALHNNDQTASGPVSELETNKVLRTLRDHNKKLKRSRRAQASTEPTPAVISASLNTTPSQESNTTTPTGSRPTSPVLSSSSPCSPKLTEEDKPHHSILKRRRSFEESRLSNESKKRVKWEPEESPLSTLVAAALLSCQ